MAVTFRRDLYGPDHEAFRDTVRAFLAKEVAPHHQRWERNGVVDREVWYSAGRQGLLGPAVDQEYGGGGSDDFRYSAVLIEEFARAGASGLALSLHNDIVGPYLTRLATEEQKRRWLPGFVSGDIVTAIAMTEPGAGSDLQGIRTTATDRGDHYLLNGSKTFISNGILADLVVVVARTTPEGGSAGQSLLVVERGADGFERGRNLAKIGQQAQDTAELFFNDVHVPKENLLGEENRAFTYLMGNLAQERLAIAVGAAAATEEILDITTRYVKEREPSAGRWPNSSTSASRSPRWPPRRRSPAPSWTAVSPSTSRAGSIPCTPRWPSGGPPNSRSGSSTAVCNSTAATAT